MTTNVMALMCFIFRLPYHGVIRERVFFWGRSGRERERREIKRIGKIKRDKEKKRQRRCCVYVCLCVCVCESTRVLVGSYGTNPLLQKG